MKSTGESILFIDSLEMMSFTIYIQEEKCI